MKTKMTTQEAKKHMENGNPEKVANFLHAQYLTGKIEEIPILKVCDWAVNFQKEKEELVEKGKQFSDKRAKERDIEFDENTKRLISFITSEEGAAIFNE